MLKYYVILLMVFKTMDPTGDKNLKDKEDEIFLMFLRAFEDRWPVSI